MKLTFLGTRGYIKARAPCHYMHSSLMVSYRGKEIMIDCGEDWLEKIQTMTPRAIFITHGHPDHAWGLKNGAPCPVFATEESWENMKTFAIKEREGIRPREPIRVHGVTFEAFSVVHSTRAPAVGYRISAGGKTIFYAPDLVYINERAEALAGAAVYIGDGATIVRSMVRKPGTELIGHTPVRTQLTWCSKEGVPRAIITHCGSEIVEGDEQELQQKIDALASERGVQAVIACDGMELLI
ncbi:MAG: MBL fold metallo-hydrolase [Candidatus Abyssobacteria bacterium SURF_5]|uniref:MBL fold metallo-hydrolase n=1 Tax=Abyssobacteria bacterium (strain SURF_5) TaxID=2093360 RepID=A0A3A4P1C9_ABYX5|nr:MAG: MBL fold metallo-hydrolase [Candidatus Abyssubacteria bacterium SURF_5]